MLQEGDSESLFREMLRVRLFEERLLAEFSRGKLFGTTHACIGQEANAVGVLSAVDRTDVVFSNHRCHGHFLAHGGSMPKLAAELFGRSSGVCGGKGGSQHLCSPTFYSNGVQGGILPNAAGIALAEKTRQNHRLVVVFLGDGTFGEGVVYEVLNIASLWALPLLLVVENNYYAQSTPLQGAFAGSFTKRFEAFAIPCTEAQTTDVLEVRHLALDQVAYVREKTQPAALVLHTYRFCAHSKGDDVRDGAEVATKRKQDPLIIHGERLSVPERDRIAEECGAEVNQAFDLAALDSWPRVDVHLTPALDPQQ